MGGGIASAIARALGGGRRDDADALVQHAVVIALGFGLVFTIAMLLGGRWIYSLMGGQGDALEAALVYSNWVFAGAALLVPLSALLIFGCGQRCSQTRGWACLALTRRCWKPARIICASSARAMVFWPRHRAVFCVAGGCQAAVAGDRQHRGPRCTMGQFTTTPVDSRVTQPFCAASSTSSSDFKTRLSALGFHVTVSISQSGL